LWADGDRLRFDAPPGKLSDAARGRLVDHKADVLAQLEREGMNAGDSALWDRLIAGVEENAGGNGDLSVRMERFRRRGCALTWDGERIRFGPFSDFAGCAWTDALSWQRDYDRHLKPFEPALLALLVGLVSKQATAVADEQHELVGVGGGW
jgi:hypothetical protein